MIIINQYPIIVMRDVIKQQYIMNSPQIQLLWQRCGVKYLQAENEQQEQIDRKIDQQGDGHMRSQEEIQGTSRARRTIPLQPIKKRHRPPNQPDNAQRRDHDRRVQVIHGHRDQIAAEVPRNRPTENTKP